MGKPEYTEIDRMGRSRSSRNGARIRNFLLHTQEGDGTAESLAGYLNNPANQVSYHYTVRDGIVCDVVDTDLASWSVGDANGFTLNLCFAGSRASWSRDRWLARRDDLRIAAWIAVQDAKKYGFSTDVIGRDYSTRRDGISDHQYVTEVIGWGTHTDCGPGFPWDVFTRDVQEFIDQPGDDMTPEQARQLQVVFDELTKRYPSRSKYRADDKPVDTAVGYLLNVDARVHEAHVEAEALDGAQWAIDLVKREAAKGDPSAQAVLAGIEGQ